MQIFKNSFKFNSEKSSSTGISFLAHKLGLFETEIMSSGSNGLPTEFVD